MLEELLNKIVPYIISILECIGVFIIAYSSLKTFYFSVGKTKISFLDYFSLVTLESLLKL